MTILECKICGGCVVPTEDKTYGTCDSCGRIVTLPKTDDEHKAGLFNRGNTFRMRGEFDKAAAVFERIIEQDEKDAEAHWCLALCRYGIEYVEDPKSGERKPTLHRMSYDLFINDVDCQAAIEHSDEYTAGLYREEAERITEIQKKVLAISNKEEPYDIFICYKEKTEDGSRTKESVIAQDIYYELTNAGIPGVFRAHHSGGQTWHRVRAVHIRGIEQREGDGCGRDIPGELQRRMGQERMETVPYPHEERSEPRTDPMLPGHGSL